jgi:hypothetical protein
MSTKTAKKTTQFWTRHVEAFKTSGLTRDAYSRKNHIRAYQLDYWRKKISRKEKPSQRIAANQWVPVNINDELTENTSPIDLWIGRVRVEIKPGFNSKLLAELLRSVGSGC